MRQVRLRTDYRPDKNMTVFLSSFFNNMPVLPFLSGLLI